MKTIQDLIQISKAEDEGKADYRVSASDLDFSIGWMGIKSEMVSYPTIEETALTQMGDKFGIPSGWLANNWRKHNGMMMDNLNYFKNSYPKPLLVRTHNNNVRAVLGGEYKPFGVTDMLEVTQRVIKEAAMPYKLLRPIVDRDELSLRIEIDGIELRKVDESNCLWSIGVLLRTGEIGLTGIHCKPFAKRTRCDNSIVFEGGFSVAHSERNLTSAYIKGSIAQFIGIGLKIAVERLENVVAAEMTQVPNFLQVKKELERKYLKSDMLSFRFLEGMEHPLDDSPVTAMNVINGLTHASKSMDIDDGIRVETLAGRILAHPESLFGIIAKQSVTA